MVFQSPLYDDKNPVLPVTLLLYGFQSPLYDDKRPVLTLLLYGFQSPLYDDKKPIVVYIVIFLYDIEIESVGQ